MRCEVINVGSELITSGSQKSAPVLYRALSSIGIRVDRSITSRDDIAELSEILTDSIRRSNIIIVIGGLGSTPDDITKNAVASALNIKTEFSRKAMENVAKYFASLGKEVPSCCDSQADIFTDAELILNERGSCPGQILDLNNKKLILLPGPKEEVESILNNYLLNYLKEKYERRIRKTLIIHIASMCESEVSDKLKDIIETERHLEEGEIEFCFEASTKGVDLRIECWGDNEMLVDEILHKTKAEVYSVLKDDIYGEDDDKLENIVGKLLTKNHKTLSVAESCTGGLLSSRITDSPGSSIYFKQGLVVYSSSAKSKMLDIPMEYIKKNGAVSKKIAEKMARRANEIYGTDFALSVTGYAGPEKGKKNNTGKGYIGLADKNNNADIRKVDFYGSRIKIKEKFVFCALEMLWRKLKNM